MLAGSAAYAIAEAMNFPGSLDSKPVVGKKFYFVVVVSVLLGLCLDAFHISAVKAIFYAAVLNGVLAPPLVFLVTRLTSSEAVMGEHKNGKVLTTLGYLAAGIMSVAAVALLITSL